jgi:hypothetical protein
VAAILHYRVTRPKTILVGTKVETLWRLPYQPYAVGWPVESRAATP